MRRLNILALLLVMGAPSATAGLTPAGVAAETDPVRTRISSELQKKYPGSRIKLNGDLNLVRGEIPRQVRSATLMSERSNGRVQLEVEGTIDGRNVSALVEVDASAWVQAWVAKKRLHPGERLSPDLFEQQEVDVLTGLAHEMRGLILSTQEDIQKLETRQSILQGHYVLSTAVQRIPLVKKGDPVRVRLISGDILLTTSGIAQEPGHLGKSLSIITQKTKKHLIGTLREGSLVEVNL